MKQLATLFLIAATTQAIGQDLIITNARIVDRTGAVIETGTIIVADGRIESVGTDIRRRRGVERIDARGMTAMPGCIDAHRHIMRGDATRFAEESAVRMQSRPAQASSCTHPATAS